jgi:hypothetical protein
MDEVSSLQMVEHVLSGIEREHLEDSARLLTTISRRRRPCTRLSRFTPIRRRPIMPEAEFRLMRETEQWMSRSF